MSIMEQQTKSRDKQAQVKQVQPVVTESVAEVLRKSLRRVKGITHINATGRRSELFPDVYLVHAAAKVGISASYLSGVLNGREQPSLKTAQRICEVLGITMDQFVEMIARQRQRKKQHSSTRANGNGRRRSRAA